MRIVSFIDQADGLKRSCNIYGYGNPTPLLKASLPEKK
jgi:hypothetical protein